MKLMIEGSAEDIQKLLSSIATGREQSEQSVYISDLSQSESDESHGSFKANLKLNGGEH